MPAISVIVPVYKVEDCLPACVESILAQSFRDFELILVDDGSPDRCGEICDAYAESDPRVRVIHQENQGLSGARNSGMDVAQGEYITFIDSDDLVTKDCLAVFYSVIREHDADIVTGLSYDFPDGHLPESFYVHEQRVPSCDVFEGKAASLEHYAGNWKLSVSAATKLFSRELIRDMRFPVGRVHEDQAFVPPAYYQSRKVVYIDTSVYYYRVRQGSITHQSFSLKRYDDLWAVEQCIRFFEERGEEKIVAAARKKRQRLICVYAIYAARAGVEVPESYRISIPKALGYLRRNVSADKYSYYLSHVNEKMVIWDARLRKIERMLGISR